MELRTQRRTRDATVMFDTLRKKSLTGLAPLGRERRILPRYPFTAAAEALDPQSRSRMTARTSDISRGGCYVDTFCPFPRNSTVKIRILREKENVIADATVVYSQMGMGMGLCFTSLEAEHQRVLDKWIGELSGEIPAAFEELFKEEAGPQQMGGNDPTFVLGELIIALIRKGALGAAEGNALLGKLVKPVPAV
jgi:hypothetical protein